MSAAAWFAVPFCPPTCPPTACPPPLPCRRRQRFPAAPAAPALLLPHRGRGPGSLHAPRGAAPAGRPALGHRRCCAGAGVLEAGAGAQQPLEEQPGGVLPQASKVDVRLLQAWAALGGPWAWHGVVLALLLLHSLRRGRLLMIVCLLFPPCSAGLVPLLLQRLDWRREQGGREVRGCCRLPLPLLSPHSTAQLQWGQPAHLPPAVSLLTPCPPACLPCPPAWSSPAPACRPRSGTGQYSGCCTSTFSTYSPSTATAEARAGAPGAAIVMGRVCGPCWMPQVPACLPACLPARLLLL